MDNGANIQSKNGQGCFFLLLEPIHISTEDHLNTLSPIFSPTLVFCNLLELHVSFDDLRGLLCFYCIYVPQGQAGLGRIEAVLCTWATCYDVTSAFLISLSCCSRFFGLLNARPFWVRITLYQILASRQMLISAHL